MAQRFFATVDGVEVPLEAEGCELGRAARSFRLGSTAHRALMRHLDGIGGSVP